MPLDDVKDYGAVGDGVTDDTAAFQAALADGIVIVPHGRYRLTQKLSKPNGDVAIIGYGPIASMLIWDNANGGIEVGVGGSTTKQRMLLIRDIALFTTRASSAGTAVRAIFRSPPPQGGNAWDKTCLMDNVEIRGESVSLQNWEIGVHLTTPMNARINNVKITGRLEWNTWNYMSRAFLFESQAASLENMITSCIVHFADVGFEAVMGSTPGFESVHITRSDFVFCNKGIRLDGTFSASPHWIIDRCHFNPALIGIEIINLIDIWISDSLFYTSLNSPGHSLPKLSSPLLHQIKLDNCIRAQINNNIIDATRQESGYWAVHIEDCTDVSIRGNKGTMAGQGGVLFFGGTNGTIGQMNKILGTSNPFLDSAGGNQWYGERA